MIRTASLLRRAGVEGLRPEGYSRSIAGLRNRQSGLQPALIKRLVATLGSNAVGSPRRLSKKDFIMTKDFVLAGVLMKRLLSGAETSGQFCLFENRSDGASRTPIHVHADDDETIYMMAGEMQAIIGGETKIIRAGETLFLKRGVP